MMSDHQYFRPWARLADLSRRLQPVQVGHADINDDDVRMQLRALFYGLSTGAGLATDLPPRVLFDEHLKAFSNDIMIVCD